MGAAIFDFDWRCPIRISLASEEFVRDYQHLRRIKVSPV